ncbi:MULTISPECIES: NUDIX hydrolase [unclassified Paracoccus (in: a-proteobacteria)]|uniref:NUDIX hydrolase n=1 Tax=unclassified Paracoccus (in: a-proteobacteria) TaxID=2688777 RepID=UPI0021E126CB|nr:MULTISPECIES: NUDIX hydrolase [unclassified Paracoccus (in: a-proteobacteria)]UXU75695.1 NUDIX hydrolase [Paracoccus sp. SMMA_5]UXU81600.1 NUDIX hydrolase [Paracoccus sp. SMMA_5_TC]
MILRDDVPWIPFPGHWDLPGGGAEPGESPIDCALRELHEECGLRLTADRLRGRRFAPPDSPGPVSWMYLGRLAVHEVAAIRLGDEGQEWQMMPLHQFLSHPRAVPHLKRRGAGMLGLADW